MMSLFVYSVLSICFSATPIFAQSSISYSSALGTSGSPTSVSTASVPIDASTLFTSSTIPVVGITSLQSTRARTTTTASISAAPQASNVQPCNGYFELCDRKLSNVSLVVAHNSPFVVPHNAASNQDLNVLTQLDDGIRGLQFETHYPNATAGLRLCHTSCDLLDAGSLEIYLKTVLNWLSENPYEVIAIMMGNDNRIPASNYIEPFKNAGLLSYLYTPPTPNMTLSEWPTLSEMIIRNERVVVMLDYLANQTEVPWLLDQFAYQWQTPFSPTDPAFPCTEQRPPNQADEVSRDRMYMVNHNLNIDVQILGQDILIPAYTLLHEVNAVSGSGSLGRNVDNCTAVWGRPPNWLLVDYYNYGNFNGSVFQVAATANKVSYNQSSCCGATLTSVAERRWAASKLIYHAFAVVCGLLLVL